MRTHANGRPSLLLLIQGLAVSIGIAGWADLADAAAFSKTGPVIAIMAGELFLGEATGHLSGAGTLSIHSQTRPDITCVGQFTSSAELGGKGQLKCRDGATSTFRFKRMTLEKGYGSGKFSRGPMNFTYGLTVSEAKPYIKLPPGKKLAGEGKNLKLVASR